jgi:hypothetical protein
LDELQRLLEESRFDDVPYDVAYAYQQLFNGDLALRVLRDLAAQTGFHAALPRGSSPELLIDHNARRAVFGRVYEILGLTSTGRETLEAAFRPSARQEDTE